MMTYIPHMGLEYSQTDPYVRLYHPIYDRAYPVDEHYPFVDDRPSWRLTRWIGFPVVLYGLIWPILLRLRAGMRVVGYQRLRSYRHLFKDGYISIANHMHPHDCEAVVTALRTNRHLRIPMYQKNFETRHQFLMRLIGGVPIPPDQMGLSALKKFNEAFDVFHQRGYHFHFFPEMAKWPWYPWLRPFKKGAFTMAYKYHLPIIPCVITFRERKGIWRLFGPKREPLITVTILDPILPDTSAPRKQEVDRLLHTSFQAMLSAMEITENPWPATLE